MQYNNTLKTVCQFKGNRSVDNIYLRLKNLAWLNLFTFFQDFRVYTIKANKKQESLEWWWCELLDQSQVKIDGIKENSEELLNNPVTSLVNRW